MSRIELVLVWSSLIEHVNGRGLGRYHSLVTPQESRVVS